MKPPEESIKQVSLRIPISLWRALRAEAGKRAISMHRLILDWLTEKAGEVR